MEKDNIIIAVTGGRFYSNVPIIWSALDSTCSILNARCCMLIDGASDDVTGPYKGADYWSHQWALARNYSTNRVHANWKQYGKAAGPIRNGEIIKLKPLVLVSFPGNAGTANMIKQAQEAGINIRFIND